MDLNLVFASMAMSKSWERVGEICWVDSGDGTPWLAAVWRCRETGELDYKPLPIVKLPSPPKDTEHD